MRSSQTAYQPKYSFCHTATVIVQQQRSKLCDLIVMITLAMSSLLLVACSGSEKPTEPVAQKPVVFTDAVGDITRTTAICGGTITSDGGATVTARGVCWSTTSTPTLSDHSTEDGVDTGHYASSLTDLAGTTTYFVVAYATNRVGTSYGDVVSFKTTDSTGSVTDVDGNVYRTIKIGNQWWFAGNLKVTHYRNGEAISHVTDSATWVDLSTGAFSIYDNDTSNLAPYGRMYNWFATNDGRGLAPIGWHVPTDDDWKQLEMSLGLSQSEADAWEWRGTDQGGRLKERGTVHWSGPNYGATDETGFAARPGGYCGGTRQFLQIGYQAHFWSSTEYSPTYAFIRYLDFWDERIYRATSKKQLGLSIRCVKD